MKRIIPAVLTGCAALTLLVVIQGCGVLGGPPTGPGSTVFTSGHTIPLIHSLASTDSSVQAAVAPTTATRTIGKR